MSLEIASALELNTSNVSPSETWGIENSIDPLEKRQRFLSCRFDQEYRYQKAKDVYQNNMDGFSTKFKVKHCNMAILHEHWESMIVWSSATADGILQSRKSARYLI